MKNIVLYILGSIIVVAAIIFLLNLNSNKLPAKSMPAAVTHNIADINRDGNVDSVDKNFIYSNMGCKKEESCWNKVVGKTSDGDNPIYASDLDLSRDGSIDQSDLNMLK